MLPEIFVDLRTAERKLSVYRAESSSEVPAIVSALAANCQSVDHADYVEIPEEMLARLGLRVVSSSGDTASDAVNKLHFDIVDLAGRSLLELASNVVWNLAPARMPKNKVIGCLREMNARDELVLSDLAESVQSAIAL